MTFAVPFQACFEQQQVSNNMLSASKIDNTIVITEDCPDEGVMFLYIARGRLFRPPTLLCLTY
jgi:hypothetical protein